VGEIVDFVQCLWVVGYAFIVDVVCRFVGVIIVLVICTVVRVWVVFVNG
jgi:hypothetical protein